MSGRIFVVTNTYLFEVVTEVGGGGGGGISNLNLSESPERAMVALGSCRSSRASFSKVCNAVPSWIRTVVGVIQSIMNQLRTSLESIEIGGGRFKSRLVGIVREGDWKLQ